MFPGRTYTLTDSAGNSSTYYKLVRDLADRFLELIPGETVLRERVRKATSWKMLTGIWPRRVGRTAMILQDLDIALSPFLSGLDDHLRTLSLAGRLDKTIRTSREQYLLYSLEIELTNRINKEKFIHAPWRMGLLAHCLRDFRDGCRSTRGDVEDLCTHCEPGCFMNLGSDLLERYQVHPYISVSMDHRRLFKHLLSKHPGMGVLGIACIPELVEGMRLCEGLDIPAVGVPLDANRCSRWLGECGETTFNMEELERLVRPETET